jgi:hypothetical protein
LSLKTYNFFYQTINKKLEIHNRFFKGKPCLLVGSSRDVGINQPSRGAKATTKGRTNEGAKQKVMQNPQ